jgi:hypothetical protein
MTVEECYKIVMSAYGTHCPKFGWNLSNLRPSQPACTPVHGLVDWLHRLSGERMTQRYGEGWGWHPDLPKNIDAATVLTSEQLAEFDRRFGALP